MVNIKITPSQQLTQILRRYEQLSKNDDEDLRYASKNKQIEIITSISAAIERLAPKDSSYLTAYNAVHKICGLDNNNIIPSLVGIARALKTAYEQGYFYEIEEVIRATVFADFLDMGEYLLSEGYKDPAAVIIGGVLEEHLRKLCVKNSIPITLNNKPMKAEGMNTELCNKGVYNMLDQKNVTAWLDLRNKAAHAKYAEFVLSQVEQLLSAVREFTARLPA